ncbi:MAG: ribulokinase [Phycisphaerae bacterium]|nr:ribulokinase [Phycisphaerae bacterium]
MTTSRYSIGVDYGTGSVRALVVDLATGAEVGTSVWEYAHGQGGVLGDRRDPECARQHPADYADGFRASVRGALADAARNSALQPSEIVGLGVDTTGSTPLPIDVEGVPLALRREFRDDLAALAWLWKDHTAHAEAAEITDAVRRDGLPYLETCGGTYSSEWYWAKILRCERAAPRVARAAASWVELCDYVPALVTGTRGPSSLRRGLCAAGHKAMYHERWGGLPSAAFLDRLSPGLSRLRHGYRRPEPSHRVAGRLTAEWASATGLPEGLPVAVGAFDAHLGAVGVGVGPGTLVKIIGTSTCDCMVAPLDLPVVIPGLCGMAPESVLPGMLGIEAGQSAVGDIFDWFANRMALHVAATPAERHATLSREAAALRPGESGLLALDWHNGNRTVLVDPRLSGLLVGQTLHTTPAETYRALIEATAYGARTIIERIEAYGVPVTSITACGGIAERSPLLMQIYADVCGRPIAVSRSPQTCALGAAVMGAVAGGGHADVPTAQRAMTGLRAERYRPDPARQAVYERLYRMYSTLHDAFGIGGPIDVGRVMKDLLALRDEVRGIELPEMGA